MADVATVAEENIVGVHVVKAFAQEQREQAKFERRVGGGLRADRRGEPAARALRAADGVPAAARAGGRAARRRADGRRRDARSLGAFVSFNVLVLMLVMPLRMLGMWIGQAQRATASGERIFEVIDEPEEIADAPGARELPPGPGRVALRGRARSATTRRGRCCTSIDLELEPGRDGRADRPHRLREDDARVARAALLRRRPTGA